MMGEDSTNNLQEQEDLLAEEYAAEDGGTGLSYYSNEDYDYEDSSPLTDVDYQPNDESSQFTSNYTGAEDFDPINRDDEDDDDQNAGGNFSDDLSRWVRTGRTVTDSDDEDDDDEEEDDEEDDESWDEDSGDIGGVVTYPDYNAMTEQKNRLMDGTIVKIPFTDKFSPSGTFRVSRSKGSINIAKIADDNAEPTGRAAQKTDAQKYNGAIKWRPGQPITFKLLDQCWDKCRKIDKLHPQIEALNQAVETALNTTGPNLMLRLNKYIARTSNQDLDTVSCLIQLAKANGRRLTFTALSVLEAFFDQQWTQTYLLASLNEVSVTAIMQMPQVKAIIDPIFAVAVPIINQAERNKK